VRFLSQNVLFLQFAVLLLLILIDVVVTVAKAIRDGKYEWNKLLCFLRTNVAPYVLIWGVLAGAGWLAAYAGITDATLGAIVVFVDIVYALILARLAASILGTFRDLGIEQMVS
jgi:hypothetical protein